MQLNGRELEASDLAGLIRARSVLGSRPLAIVEGDTLTYGSAGERSSRIASSLRAIGVGKGDVVATLMANSCDHICAWFACAKLGAIWAPMNVALASFDLAHTLGNASPRVFIVDAELLDTALAAAGPELTIVVRGGKNRGDDRGPSFAELASGDLVDPGVDLAPSDPAALVYTGGTTGMPKGVLVPHLWYFGGAMRFREIFEPLPGDVHMGVGQLCHTLGSAVDVAAPMYLGLTTVLSRRFSASGFWDVARRHGVTSTLMVGPLLSLLLSQPERDDDADTPLRTAGTASGQVSRQVAEDFAERFQVELLELYGQTETGPLGCIGQRRWDRPHHSVGRPYGWAEVRVGDASGQACRPGETGQILLRETLPHTFMLGYYRNPIATAEAWRDGWFHTGDLGHLDAGGYLHFDGRLEHSIRRRGESIAVMEVEQTLLLHPDVAECAVVGVPSDVGEEDVKAYVVLREAAQTPPEELVRFCEERIAYFKVPRYVELTPGLPRSVTKSEIERHRLRERGIGLAWDRQAAGLTSGSVARR